MIFMYNISISSVGLRYLKRMTKLRKLYATDKLLSGPDALALVEALPELEVYRSHTPQPLM
jgi:hypothetical protein